MAESLPFATDVEEVLQRYAAAIDAQEWDALRECFAADCVVDYDQHEVSGAEGVVIFMARAHRRVEGSIHRIVAHEPSLEDGSTIASVDARLRSRGSHGLTTIRFEGVYRDRWARTPGGLRISHRIYRTFRRSEGDEPHTARD